MEKQYRSSTVWRWIVIDESFTERGDERFVEEAIGLLMGFFRYVGPEKDAGVPTGSQGWDVEHSLSDRQIGRLLSICRKASKLDIAPSGQLVDTGIPRSNQDGALDEGMDSLCPEVRRGYGPGAALS